MTLPQPSNFSQRLMLSYLEQLTVHPIKTKALTSCILSIGGNLIAQKIGDAKTINKRSVFASGVFGLLVSGTVPHFLYKLLNDLVPPDSKNAVLKQLLIERLLFTPAFLYFVLYTVNRLQGKSHEDTCKERDKIYWTLLKANLQVITLIQLINLKYVPPTLRVLVGNLTGFFWIIYTTHKRQAAAKKEKDV